MVKIRLDQLLVQRELVKNREEAQRLIRAGKVLADEQIADKPGIKYSQDIALRVSRPESCYAGRGGLKLEYALQRFSITVQHLIVADLGASTGGFTECLLKSAAQKVYAVDVGYGQLAYHLQTDPRVIVLDRTNCRYLTAENLGEQVDLIVADLSFISIKTVFPAMDRILKPHGESIVLIKPQFEIGKGKVGKKGIVRKPEDHIAVLQECFRFYQNAGWGIKGLSPSPILGKTGNIEFLMYLSRIQSSISESYIVSVVEEAHALKNELDH